MNAAAGFCSTNLLFWESSSTKQVWKKWISNFKDVGHKWNASPPHPQPAHSTVGTAVADVADGGEGSSLGERSEAGGSVQMFTIQITDVRCWFTWD